MQNDEMKLLKNKADELINNATSILIVSHTHPDPDALCSALGMQIYIKRKFKDKKTVVMFEGNKSDLWDFLVTADTVRWEQDVSKEISKYDLVILLDGRPMRRFTAQHEEINIHDKKYICIDHHQDEEPDYDINIIDNKLLLLVRYCTEYSLRMSWMHIPTRN
jgi:nanoRNase/pAp phosphatase (c-di-AMP/oligoRNAs hydrolase)